ncbi:MAG TPA: primosomal protein N' [Solirubrobacteraceae bacterium]|nr:primosomal protein N' [Solirubrobacteraceae bacterium]
MPPVAKVEPITTARALRGPFDYLRPAGVGVGSVLVVPFGHRDVVGVVVGLADTSELADDRLVAPRRVLDHDLPPELVELAGWMAAEYCSTPARALALVSPPPGGRAKVAWWAGAVGAADADDATLVRRLAEGSSAPVASAVPAGAGAGSAASAAASRPISDRQRALLDGLRESGPRAAGSDLAALRRLAGRGLVTLERRPVRRFVSHDAVGARRAQPPPLTPDQLAVLGGVEHELGRERPEPLLLHGVTGSGKTEIYLRAAATALQRGRGVIVLVPEIGLTPQIVSRFVDRFGDTVAVLHSRLSPGERHDEWSRLRSADARVCIGPRSAVFAPIERLGLIVLDEEHDASYKHEGDPRYDARDVAARRARESGALLLAGSATPRPESVHRLRRVRLPARVDGRPLPPVEIVDMRQTDGALHPQTSHALVDASKAIVLLNRRGWSNFVDCRTCGHAWMCPQCDVALVLHRSRAQLSCHHCGHRERVPARCGECGSVSVARHGAGTERLEHDLTQIGHEVFRLDADVADAGAVLRRFEAAPRGILVGTQMVAKGHDFPDVTLAVVVDADGTLRFPDFRAEERTFALVTQLAGRAGRGPAGGRVLVQTLSPDAASIVAAAHHDADGFLASELARRAALRYPPFSHLIRIVVSAPELGAMRDAAQAVRAQLGEIEAAQVLGPAPLFRLRGRERAQLVIKAGDRAGAVHAAGAAVDAVAADRRRRGVAYSVDVDPQ